MRKITVTDSVRRKSVRILFYTEAQMSLNVLEENLFWVVHETLYLICSNLN